MTTPSRPRSLTPARRCLGAALRLAVGSNGVIAMKRSLVSIAMGVGLLSAMLPAPALAADGSPAPAAPSTPSLSATRFGALQPGQTVKYRQRVPINIVFLGFKPSQIDRNAFLQTLPASSTPVIRDWMFYGLSGRDVGLRYDYDYHVSFAGSGLTDRFFAYLRTSGQLIQPTVYQQAYNDEASNVLDVTGPVLLDDGPSVEDWLERHLDVSPKGDTLVFVNWYGRPDFQFHLYGKSGVDPDTGFDFGRTQAYGTMMAWGGSHGRLWFDDLSAGPDWNTTNWEVDDPDLNGDGVVDYRIPPIWEYTPGGFRSPSALTTDLGLVARYVGLDTLFTSSPLFDPLYTSPGVDGRKVIQVNMFEDDPTTHGADALKLSTLRSSLADLEPYDDWRTRLIDRDPIDPGALEAWRIAAGVTVKDDCWNTFGSPLGLDGWLAMTPYAELQCYFSEHADQYFPSGRASDYVGNVLAFNTTDANFNDSPYVGEASDTWLDPRQSFIYAFLYTSLRPYEGFTHTTIHESAHHFAGLSHPHDGYDPASGRSFVAFDDFTFAWIGDESDTIMSYQYVADEFSRFDKDNVRRWEMAGYLNWANSLLGKVLEKPGALKYLPALVRADADARRALDAFARWDHLTAAMEARKAYVELQDVATRLQVTLPADQVAARADATARLYGTSQSTQPLETVKVPDDLAPLEPFDP